LQQTYERFLEDKSIKNRFVPIGGGYTVDLENMIQFQTNDSFR